MKKLFFIILLSIVFGCKDKDPVDKPGETPEVPVEEPIHVTGVTIDTQTFDLRFNFRHQLTATVFPASADDKSVIWESSDPSVATVDINGYVSGKQVGEAIITVTTGDGKFKAECDVTVMPFEVCLPCYLEKGICTEDGYEPPDMSDLNGWLGSPNRFATLQIPDACLEIISTKSLLKACLDFPYLIFMFASNDYQMGFELGLLAAFNGFRELMERPDLIDVLIEKYANLGVEVQAMRDSGDEGNFSFRHFVVAFMLTQDVVFDNLSEEQKKTLVLLSFENREIRNSNPDIFGGWHITATHLLYAKIAINDPDFEFESEEQKNGVLRFIQVPHFMDQKTADYIENYINVKFK